MSLQLFRFPQVLLAVLITLYAGHSHAASPGDEEVVAFFQSVEESFKNKDVLEILRHVDRGFFYIMTYCTPDTFSFLESDFDKYRASVGSFFKSKPEIYEYSIVVDKIQRSGKDIMVLARIKSVVQLNSIINSCDAWSNYLVHYVDDEFIIKDVRGDANCINKLAN